MGKALRTAMADLADELNRRGRYSAAVALRRHTVVGAPNPHHSDALVKLLVDIIEGKE